jgi:hypothetical protein
MKRQNRQLNAESRPISDGFIQAQDRRLVLTEEASQIVNPNPTTHTSPSWSFDAVRRQGGVSIESKEKGRG